MKKGQELKKYHDMLPERILVKIESSEEDGLWAKVSTADGRLSNCYTQAANIAELIPMINDAVQTHFDIPTKYRKEVGYYVPLSDEHIRLEDMFNHLVSLEKQANLQGKSQTTLTLRESQLQVC